MSFSLECQGILSKTAVESIKKANIITWSNTLTIMPEPVFNFARKVLQQQYVSIIYMYVAIVTMSGIQSGGDVPKKHLAFPVEEPQTTLWLNL